MGRKARIAGWILSWLIALFMIVASGVPKFVDFPGKQEMFEKSGWSIDTMKIIGVVEIVVALLFALPRVGFVGAILLTGYLGGAVATHVRISEPPVFPILFGVLAWVALGLRHPGIFAMAAGRFPRGTDMPAIRVILPYHLTVLARCEREISLDVTSMTIKGVLDALETRFPMLAGTVREHGSLKRRPLVRFYACEEDLSHVSPETPLPEPVVSGKEPFIILGAIAGG